MKSLTKVMTGMSVAALSIMLAGGVDADAAAVSATIGTDKTLTGLKAGDAISFDAVDVKNNAIKAKAKWDLYEADENTVADLSSVKTTSKDGWFAVKSKDGTVTPYKIKADTKKKFNATVKNNVIEISVGGTAVAADADIARFSWRTENSTTWTAFTKVANDFSAYAMQGSTIYIRYMGAAATVKTTTASSADIKSVGKDTADLSSVTIDADSFIAKEFKVKITKKANAPAINVDYAKGIIKKNAKAQYNLSENDSSAVAADTVVKALVSASAAPDLADTKIDLKKNGAIAVRTKAAGNKPASKIAVLSWTKVTAPAIDSNAKSIAAAVTTATKLTSDENVKYETVGNGTKAKFKLTNTSDVTYEIFKSSDDVYTAKPVATLKAKTGKVEWTAAKMPATTELKIRVAGDKKACTLPSDLSTDTFKAYYAPAPTAAPTTAP